MLFSASVSMLLFPLGEFLENGIEEGGFYAETYFLHAILTPERYLDFGRSQSQSSPLFSLLSQCRVKCLSHPSPEFLPY